MIAIKKIIVISEQQNTSAMHILYYLARSKDVKRPTWLFCFSRGKYGMPWEMSEVIKIPFIVLLTPSSNRDFTATSEVQASLARSPIRFCNHETQLSAASIHIEHTQQIVVEKHTLHVDGLRAVSPPVWIKGRTFSITPWWQSWSTRSTEVLKESTMLIKQAATFSTIWKLTSLRNKSLHMWRCLSFWYPTSQLARNLLNFLPQPPHAITRRLDKFRDFWTSFAFYII